jgi:hypothetical protein
LTGATVERIEPVRAEPGTPVDRLAHFATLMRQIAVGS